MKPRKSATALAEMVLAAVHAQGFELAHHVTIKRVSRTPAGANWEIDVVTLTDNEENIRLLTCAAEVEADLQALYDLDDDA